MRMLGSLTVIVSAWLTLAIVSLVQVGGGVA